MEEILIKKSESKFIGIREIFVVTLFSVLTYLVSMLTAMPFAASVHLQLYVGSLMPSLSVTALIMFIKWIDIISYQLVQKTVL